MEPLIHEAEELFKKNNGYARTKHMREAGIHSMHIKQLEEKGLISKIKRGLYRWVNEEMNHHEELVNVAKIVPRGVICLVSALSFYELTTYQPWEYYVAIHRKDTRIRLPYYPPIQLVYYSDMPYHEGIQDICINGHQLQIYSMEKTLCDVIRYRNKVGQDIVSESMKSYAERRDKNISELMDYAKKMRVQSIVRHYMEVLI